jgi:hypothetical protein
MHLKMLNLYMRFLPLYETILKIFFLLKVPSVGSELLSMKGFTLISILK